MVRKTPNNKKKIKSLRKKYAIRHALNFGQRKKFSENYKPMKV